MNELESALMIERTNVLFHSVFLAERVRWEIREGTVVKIAKAGTQETKKKIEQNNDSEWFPVTESI